MRRRRDNPVRLGFECDDVTDFPIPDPAATGSTGATDALAATFADIQESHRRIRTFVKNKVVHLKRNIEAYINEERERNNDALHTSISHEIDEKIVQAELIIAGQLDNKLEDEHLKFETEKLWKDNHEHQLYCDARFTYVESFLQAKFGYVPPKMGTLVDTADLVEGKEVEVD
eukprot:g10610.t1